MQERLEAIIAGFDCKPPSPDYLRLLSVDIIEGGPKQSIGIEALSRAEPDVSLQISPSFLEKPGFCAGVGKPVTGPSSPRVAVQAAITDAASVTENLHRDDWIHGPRCLASANNGRSARLPRPPSRALPQRLSHRH